MNARLGSCELLARLVAFDTVSRHSNRALVEFVRDYLDGYGVRSTLIDSDDGSKANLFATVGRGLAGGVVLSGHTDVVPVDGQRWRMDPFRVEQRDGRLYGRGTCDMKGYIACVLAAVPDMVAAPLQRPLHLALSYDEEVGCLGAPRLIERMRTLGCAPEAVLVGEPTRLAPVDRHKGLVAVTTSVTGHAAHSSQPHRGVSAVQLACMLVAWLADAAGRHAQAVGGRGFEPPYGTLSVNRIAGGTAVNILAGECEFTWDFRHLPDDDPDALLDGFRAFCADLERRARQIAPAVRVVSRELARVPPLARDTGAARALVAQLTGCDDAGGVSYCTEGGQFQRAGFSTVVCGPGSIDQAHQPDEFIDTSELARCDDYLQALIARQTRAPEGSA